jgi:hypothetical protein
LAGNLTPSVSNLTLSTGNLTPSVSYFTSLIGLSGIVVGDGLRTIHLRLDEGAPRRLVGPLKEAVLLLRGLLCRLVRGKVFLFGGDVLGEAGNPLESRALVLLGDENAALQFSLATLLLLRDEARRRRKVLSLLVRLDFIAYNFMHDVLTRRSSSAGGRSQVVLMDYIRCAVGKFEQLLYSPCSKNK